MRPVGEGANRTTGAVMGFGAFRGWKRRFRHQIGAKAKRLGHILAIVLIKQHLP
jgi:hypothetical protein